MTISLRDVLCPLLVVAIGCTGPVAPRALIESTVSAGVSADARDHTWSLLDLETGYDVCDGEGLCLSSVDRDTDAIELDESLAVMDGLVAIGADSALLEDAGDGVRERSDGSAGDDEWETGDYVFFGTIAATVATVGILVFRRHLDARRAEAAFEASVRESMERLARRGIGTEKVLRKFARVQARIDVRLRETERALRETRDLAGREGGTAAGTAARRRESELAAEADHLRAARTFFDRWVMRIHVTHERDIVRFDPRQNLGLSEHAGLVPGSRGDIERRLAAERASEPATIGQVLGGFGSAIAVLYFIGKIFICC